MCHVNAFRIQRTVRADRAEVTETPLDEVGEVKSYLSAANTPAALVPDTTNSEIARNALFETVADGMDMSGYGV